VISRPRPYQDDQESAERLKDAIIVTDDLPVLGSEPPMVGRLNPLLRHLQANRPIGKVRTHAGDEAWMVTRYAEVKQLLLDKRLGRSHPDPPSMPRYLDSPLMDALVTTTDPEEDRRHHLQIRSVLTPLFSAKRMAAWRPRIVERVREALDAVLAKGPSADMHSQFSVPLTFRVLCDVLGVSELDKLWTLLTEVGDSGPFELLEYMASVVAHKRASPADDVISILCATQPDDNIVGSHVLLLPLAYQATPQTMSASIALLAAHPDQRDLLISDPALLPGAVEEALRMGTVGDSFLPRYASEDIEIGGVTIKTGDLVLCEYLSASLDDRVFDESDRFDITRSPNPHLAFSHGMWHCIGAPLARMEIQEVFPALLSRMPALELTVPLEELHVTTEEQAGAGIVSIPVTWADTH
jgi:cytochrome P450 monooxygenase